MFVPLILVKIQRCTLSTYELQGTGEQAEELVKFKAFFLENDYDLPKEMPDYIPHFLNYVPLSMKKKQKKFTTIVSQNWNTLENASLRLNCLMHSCLILSCLLQMDWRTVHDESIPLGRVALHRIHLLNRRVLWFVSSTLKETGLQNRVNF